jgi:hypothetical protein
MTTVAIVEGCIRVASYDVLDTPSVVWVQIDCHSKRPVIGCHFGGDGIRGVMLDKDEHTLHTADSEDATLVELGLDGDGWTIVAEAGRYTVNVVVAVKREGGGG